MYQHIITELGLTKKEADIYEILLQIAPATIKDILTRSPYKRGDLYNILAGLEEWGLLEFEEKDGKKHYVPTHPNRLREILAEQEETVHQTKQLLGDNMGKLESMFNMISSKPGIKYFEGIEGIMDAYDEILAIGKPIYAIVEDDGGVFAALKQYFKKYVPKRVRLGIPNYSIIPDSNPHTSTNKKALRYARTVPKDQFPFSIHVKIVADSVFIFTVEEHAMAIRIDHPIIAQNFKLMHDFFWAHGTDAPEVAAQFDPDHKT